VSRGSLSCLHRSNSRNNNNLSAPWTWEAKSDKVPLIRMGSWGVHAMMQFGTAPTRCRIMATLQSDWDLEAAPSQRLMSLVLKPGSQLQWLAAMEKARQPCCDA